MNDLPLWRTIVGSHVWGMNHPGSDTDYFDCYAVDTRALLRGEVHGGEVPGHGAHFHAGGPGGEDVQNHEVGKWVVECLKSNFNYIVGVFSPLVVSDPFGLLGGPDGFRSICNVGRAKNIYPSLNGMVRHNLALYRKHGLDGSNWDKKLAACLRALQFGIRWMNREPVRFLPPWGAVSETAVLDALDVFKATTDHSTLPERPINEDAYRDFLYRVRMARLSGMFRVQGLI